MCIFIIELVNEVAKTLELWKNFEFDYLGKKPQKKTGI